MKLYDNLNFLASCKESKWNTSLIEVVRENENILSTLRIEYKNILAEIFDNREAEKLRLDYCWLISKRGPYWWMKRYGISFNEAVDKISENQNIISLESFQERYGSRDGWHRYRRYIRRRLRTLSQWDEEYRKLVNSLKSHPNTNLSPKPNSDRTVYDTSSKESFMRKFGAVEGLRKYREKTKNCTNNLENFQRIYGEDEGRRRWKKRTENWLTTLNNKTDEEKELINLKRSHSVEGIMARGHSFEEAMDIYNDLVDRLSSVSTNSQILFEKIADIIGDDGIYYHNLNYEKNFGNKRVDFYDTKSNIVVEYLGDLYHANPKTYEADDIIKTHFFVKKAKDIWQEDRTRELILENKFGLQIYNIWENIFLKDQDLIAQQIAQFIVEKRKEKNVA